MFKSCTAILSALFFFGSALVASAASLLPADPFAGVTADVTAIGTGIVTVGIIIVGVALLMKAFR